MLALFVFVLCCHSSGLLDGDLDAQEVGEHLRAFLGEKAFGVKLHAFDGGITKDTGLGTDAHDFAFVGPCCFLKAFVIECVRQDHQAVVPGAGGRVFQSGK